MSSTIYAADAVDLFAGEFAGIRLIEDEFGRFIAYGHMNEADLLAGVAAYCEEYGGDLHGATADGLPVEHVWAVLRHEDDAAGDEGWAFSWLDVTERTPHAISLTVVPR